ncbi:MAG: alpha-amylase family protein, partial [Fimbriimonas sp.]
MPLERAKTLRTRQVHLDFHTSPTIAGIGKDFDKAEFAATASRARVNSMTVFGRCHHGMAYYPSKVAPVHPGLDFDLLGAQIESLHSAGIRAPIYLTVTWDQHIGDVHPDWLQRKPDGGTYGGMPDVASWHWVSSAVPEYADYLEAQVDELFDLYGDEVDGFFWDIVMTGGEGDCHPLAIAKRVERGLPDTVAGRKQSDHITHRALMHRLSERIADRKADATVFYNSRFGLEFREEEASYSHVEIEALPTGGWGYGYFPLWARYGRNFGFPYLGMTGRFHTHWGDFGALKEASTLKFECGGIVANAGQCSIGDQLHPGGRLDPAVYDCIGEAYADVEALEPWTTGATALTEIALLLHTKSDSAQAGAAKVFLEEHWQFDAIDVQADFSRFRAIVVPDGFPDSPGLAEKLRGFVAAGGALVLG